MHLKPRHLSVFLLVLALGTLAVSAMAQTLPTTLQATHLPMAQAAPAAPQILHHPFDRLRECLSILDLSDAQKADIKAIFDAAKPQRDAFAATLKTDRDALQAELAKAPPDPCAVGNAFLQLHVDREAARIFLESVRDQLLAVLTPEQRARLAGCLLAPRHAATLSSEESGPVE